jgi:hypothetical protein
MSCSSMLFRKCKTPEIRIEQRHILRVTGICGNTAHTTAERLVFGPRTKGLMNSVGSDLGRCRVMENRFEQRTKACLP